MTTNFLGTTVLRAVVSWRDMKWQCDVYFRQKNLGAIASQHLRQLSR